MHKIFWKRPAAVVQMHKLYADVFTTSPTILTVYGRVQLLRNESRAAPPFVGPRRTFLCRTGWQQNVVILQLRIGCPLLVHIVYISCTASTGGLNGVRQASAVADYGGLNHDRGEYYNECYEEMQHGSSAEKNTVKKAEQKVVLNWNT